MSVYVGLDCGGTSCRVLAVDAEGQTLHTGQGGAANIVSTPPARLKRNLESALQGCPPAAYVCGCFAGLVTDDIQRRAMEVLRPLFPGARLRVEPDYTAALYAAPAETDVCVIAGTGSLVCSRVEGRIVRSGGRGYVLGDEGSAFQYGRDALLAYLRDPAGASANLTRTVQEVFRSLEEPEIVAAIYRNGTPAATLGRMAKAIEADVKAEMPYALESVRRNTDALAEVVVRHVHRHLPQRPSLNLCLAGGMWKGTAAIREAFHEALTTRLERPVAISRIQRPPLYGAVELAREMNGVSERAAKELNLGN